MAEVFWIWLIGEMFFIFTPFALNFLWTCLCLSMLRDPKHKYPYGQKSTGVKVTKTEWQHSVNNNEFYRRKEYRELFGPEVDSDTVHANLKEALDCHIPGTRVYETIRGPEKESNKPIRFYLNDKYCHYTLFSKEERMAIGRLEGLDDFYSEAAKLVDEEAFIEKTERYTCHNRSRDYIIFCDFLEIFKLHMGRDIWDWPRLRQNLNIISLSYACGADFDKQRDNEMIRYEAIAKGFLAMDDCPDRDKDYVPDAPFETKLSIYLGPERVKNIIYWNNSWIENSNDILDPIKFKALVDKAKTEYIKTHPGKKFK